MKLKYNHYLCLLLGAMAIASCSDDTSDAFSWEIGDGSKIDYPEDYFTGGQLGTTTNNSSTAYKQPSLAVENAGMVTAFNEGEYLFEKDFNTNTTGAFRGLGPVYVRPGCNYCHPGYGHGARQNAYSATQERNGYLLVIYDKQTNAYIRSVAGMPQTAAVKPFKAPIDESQIRIDWKHYTDEWGNKFDDGETYDLTYPEVTIPASAYYAPVYVQRNGKDVEIPASEYDDNIAIRLESTIGIYGTGLLDAITDEDITAQWQAESPYVTLNPAMWDQAANTWKSYYSNTLQGDGTKYVRRFTYALSRGPVLDGAGANAIWNITNVSRPDRPKLYSTKAWAKAMSEDPVVIAKIKANPQSPYYADGTDAGIKEAVYNLLLPSTNQFDNQWHNFQPEMTANNFYDFMVWHRGLAIPRARNLNDKDVQRGRKLFYEMQCTACHRPKWNTGDDNYWTPNMIADKPLPRYQNQTIYPYSDMIQHKLYMKNDIHGSWCRTTPLWGRGLSRMCTGAEDRLHDCRARNEVEAIMWHAYSKNSHAYASALKFYNLPKADRDAVVKFLQSI